MALTAALIDDYIGLLERREDAATARRQLTAALQADVTDASLVLSLVCSSRLPRGMHARILLDFVFSSTVAHAARGSHAPSVLPKKSLHCSQRHPAKLRRPTRVPPPRSRPSPPGSRTLQMIEAVS